MTNIELQTGLTEFVNTTSIAALEFDYLLNRTFEYHKF
jgi:hypothetical protein